MAEVPQECPFQDICSAILDNTWRDNDTRVYDETNTPVSKFVLGLRNGCREHQEEALACHVVNDRDCGVDARNARGNMHLVNAEEELGNIDFNDLGFNVRVAQRVAAIRQSR
jgi:hypothetical protein